MITRFGFDHDFTPYNPDPVAVPGSIQLRQAGLGTQGNVTAAMPISRPNSSPYPGNGAPFYASRSYTYRQNHLIRGGVMTLTPTAPKQMMDPLDQNTWQRPYIFS